MKGLICVFAMGEEFALRRESGDGGSLYGVLRIGRTLGEVEVEHESDMSHLDDCSGSCHVTTRPLTRSRHVPTRPTRPPQHTTLDCGHLRYPSTHNHVNAPQLSTVLRLAIFTTKSVVHGSRIRARSQLSTANATHGLSRPHHERAHTLPKVLQAPIALCGSGLSGLPLSHATLPSCRPAQAGLSAWTLLLRWPRAAGWLRRVGCGRLLEA